MGVWPRQPNLRPVARTGFLQYRRSVCRAGRNLQVAAAGRKGGADHAGGDEAVHRHGVLRLFQCDQSGADPADPGGRRLDEGAVQHRHRQVGRADIVDGRVGATHVSLGNLDAPEQLDETEDGHPAHHLGHRSHRRLLPAHLAL